MGPGKEEGRKSQRAKGRDMIFRYVNVKVKYGKDAVQAGGGKRWKRNRSSLSKGTKCQIENFKRTGQKGLLTERENWDT